LLKENLMRRTSIFHCCVAILIAVCLVTLPVSAQQKRGPSTAEERAKAVQLAHHLEDEPLASDAVAARRWLTVWLTEVPDITVEVCFSVLGKDLDPKKSYSTEISVQMIYSQAAFVIENPDKATDRDAAFVAGVKGALKVYQAIQKEKPKTKYKCLDDLLAQLQNGTLEAVVKQSVAENCKQNAPGQK
jgi:hypothetical protein